MLVAGKHFNFLSYLLTLTGYMTLMMSLSLVPSVAKGLQISVLSVQSGIGLIFLLFSLSAIILSSLSDMLGAGNVLKVAQIISMIGLLLLGGAVTINRFYFACVLVGLATGCYSSIARSIISRHAATINQMKKSFSNLSICLVIAPILASYLAHFLITINWRFAYYAMAMIELMVFLYAFFVLAEDKKHQQLLTARQVLLNFVYCFSQVKFLLNLIAVGIAFSIFMQIIMANIHAVLVGKFLIDEDSYRLLLLGCSSFYIIGIFSYRHLTQLSHYPVMRLIIVMLLMLGILLLSVANSCPWLSVSAFYLICFSLGFMVPLFTGAAMAVIKTGQGTAAALFTFSFSLVSSIWSFMQAHIDLSAYGFILLASWLSVAILLATSVLFFAKCMR